MTCGATCARVLSPSAQLGATRAGQLSQAKLVGSVHGGSSMRSPLMQRASEAPAASSCARPAGLINTRGCCPARAMPQRPIANIASMDSSMDSDEEETVVLGSGIKLPATIVKQLEDSNGIGSGNGNGNGNGKAKSMAVVEVMDYSKMGVVEIMKTRTGWLAFFCAGLLLSASVVQHFDNILSSHLELSFFVPLVMGQGGNSGSQTTASLIRATALRQVAFEDVLPVMLKESTAGFLMGASLGAAVLLLSQVTHTVSLDVALAVGISLPLVSLWSNALGAGITLTATKLGLDATSTSTPLVTTILDSTALILYFEVANYVLENNFIAALESTKTMFM